MSHPKTILESLGANALKRLSQNFLTSPHWADLLTDAVLEPEGLEEVWEIGPGLGALTERLLAKTSLPVRAFELDRKLAAHLRATQPKLDLREGDVMDADFRAISPGARIAVLSNLPYHLSSPILFKLVDERDRLSRAVLTFQKEFADRLVAAPRSPDYGGLTVMVQYHFTTKSLGILPPGAFYPPPGVSSQALLLLPKSDGPVAARTMSRIVKAAFAHRRKKLSSNLKEAFEGAPVAEILAAQSIAPDARPETLSPEAYVALAVALAPHVPPG